MFYNYNNVTGRVGHSSSIQSPLFPMPPLAAKAAGPAGVTYDPSVKLSKVTAIQVRQQSGQRNIPGTTEKYSPLNPKLKAQMELFQRPNDIPVFLKGGPMDLILYRATFGLAIVGVLWSWSIYYKRAFMK